jgi:hypothetical protein
MVDVTPIGDGGTTEALAAYCATFADSANPFLRCTAGICCAPFATCDLSANCQDYRDCFLNGCEPGADVIDIVGYCQSVCADADPTGAQQYNAFMNCADLNCYE